MNVIRTLGFLRGLLSWLQKKISNPFRIWRDVLESRRYANEVCNLRKDRLKPEVGKSILRLGVVGGYPVLNYVLLGYDWLAPYYNPLLIFDEVHYFQTTPTRISRVDWGYPLYIHYFTNALDVIRVCEEYHISILRAYDPLNGLIASEAARMLNVPVIVSVH